MGSFYGQVIHMLSLLEKGYYDGSDFYKDTKKSTIIPASNEQLYLDLNTNNFYIWQDNEYKLVGGQSQTLTAVADNGTLKISL